MRGDKLFIRPGPPPGPLLFGQAVWLLQPIVERIRGHVFAAAKVRERDGASRVALLDRFLDNWLETYDVILVSRVDESIPIVSDGLRARDPAYRRMLDSYASKILLGRTRVHELPFGECPRRRHPG